jgi:hypothetical protein
MSYAVHYELCCTLIKKVDPNELCCTLWAMLYIMSYAVPLWAMQYPCELCWTLVRYAVWVSYELCYTLMSYAVPLWARVCCNLMRYAVPYPFELQCCILLNYAAFCQGTLHPVELRLTLLLKLSYVLPSYAVPYWATSHPLSYAAPYFCYAALY